MLCCQGFEVKNYDFTLGRLAYESLRLVQDPDKSLSLDADCIHHPIEQDNGSVT